MRTEITTADPVLQELLRRLVEAYHPERVYLFGSHARAKQDADSDYDLAVIVSDSAPAELRRSRRAYQALRGTGVAADVIVWTREEFEARLGLRASLPARIAEEGRVVYAA